MQVQQRATEEGKEGGCQGGSPHLIAETQGKTQLACLARGQLADLHKRVVSRPSNQTSSLASADMWAPPHVHRRSEQEHYTPRRDVINGLYMTHNATRAPWSGQDDYGSATRPPEMSGDRFCSSQERSRPADRWRWNPPHLLPS